MLGGLGTWEILIIFLAILVLFGAKRIPEIARGLGKGITEFKRAVKDVKDEIETSAEETPSTPSQPPPNTTPTSSPEAEKKVES